MKKLLYGMMAIFAILVVSCNDEEEPPAPVPPIEGPSITAPSGVTVMVNKDVDMDFSIISNGGISKRG